MRRFLDDFLHWSETISQTTKRFWKLTAAKPTQQFKAMEGERERVQSDHSSWPQGSKSSSRFKGTASIIAEILLSWAIALRQSHRIYRRPCAEQLVTEQGSSTTVLAQINQHCFNKPNAATVQESNSKLLLSLWNAAGLRAALLAASSPETNGSNLPKLCVKYCCINMSWPAFWSVTGSLAAAMGATVLFRSCPEIKLAQLWKACAEKRPANDAATSFDWATCERKPLLRWSNLHTPINHSTGLWAGWM